MPEAVQHVEQAIFVALPRSSVAAFMFNPLNEVIWCQGTLASRPSAPGRMVPGMRVVRSIRLWGKKLNVVYQVEAVHGEAGAELRVSAPSPLIVRYTLSAEGAGTRISLRMETEAGGLFMPAGPLLRPFVTRRIRRELWRLKRHLEHASSPSH